MGMVQQQRWLRRSVLVWGPAICLLLASCEESAEEKRCRDTTTAYVMAKSTINQRFSQHDVSHPPRTEVSIKTQQPCSFHIEGQLTLKSASGTLQKRDYSATMRLDQSGYWNMDEFDVKE